MELRRLGTSGLRVSAPSLGAMLFGASQTLMKGVTSSEEEARRVFDRVCLGHPPMRGELAAAP